MCVAASHWTVRLEQGGQKERRATSDDGSIVGKELLLPPIEHDKLAWTDPDSTQTPSQKDVDFARSLRVQALRFGLQGELMKQGNPCVFFKHTRSDGLRWFWVV